MLLGTARRNECVRQRVPGVRCRVSGSGCQRPDTGCRERPGRRWSERYPEIGRSAAAGRFEPDFGVLEDQRFLRRTALAPHGLQKAVRGGLAVFDVGAREYAVHGAVRPFAGLGGDCCVCWRTCIYRCRAGCPEPCLIRTCQVSARRTRGCRTRAPRLCWRGCLSIRSIRGRPAPGTACRTPTAGG